MKHHSLPKRYNNEKVAGAEDQLRQEIRFSLFCLKIKINEKVKLNPKIADNFMMKKVTKCSL